MMRAASCCAKGQDGVEIVHKLSLRGERLATTLPDGRRIGFGYDQDSLFEQLSFQDRDVLQLTRDRMGRETLREGGGIGMQTDYDPDGRIERQRAYRQRRDAPAFGRSYGYDQAGLIRSIRDVARGERAFQYDAREQLRRVTLARRARSSPSIRPGTSLPASKARAMPRWWGGGC
jgi:hypothetical protein